MLAVVQVVVVVSDAEVDNRAMHTLQMESKSWSELWKLTLPALLSWSAVILRLPELFMSLRIRPHQSILWIFPLHSKQWCVDSSSFASSGALHRDPTAHFACCVESFFMATVAADVDVAVVCAGGGC
jgi:hypothetical protein